MSRKTSEYPHDLLIALKQLQAFNDADDIFEHFRERGIKGDAGLVNNCAIAVYIYSAAPDDLYEVTVNDSGITWLFREEMEERHPKPHEIGCTPAMASFIGLFDQHCYPEIERKQDEDE